MRRVTPFTVMDDERGMLREVVREGTWKQMNHFTIKKGEMRGNHYHKKLVELFYVVVGSVEFTVHKMPDWQKETFVLTVGQSVIIEPGDYHTLLALEDTAIMSLYSEVFDPKDIYES